MPRKRNILNIRFNRLLVIDVGSVKKGRQYWICACDCGTTKEVSVNHLRDGGAQSCGCLKKEMLQNRCIKYPGNMALNKLINSYKQSAKKRGYSWQLTNEDCEILFKSNCSYCGRNPSQTFKDAKKKHLNDLYIYNGIDRIDNDLDYIKDNCTSCCGICNSIKSNLSVNDFLQVINNIYFHQLSKS